MLKQRSMWQEVSTIYSWERASHCSTRPMVCSDDAMEWECFLMTIGDGHFCIDNA